MICIDTGKNWYLSGCMQSGLVNVLFMVSLNIERTISFLIGRKRTVNFRNQRLWRHRAARTLKVAGNHVMYDRGAWFLRVIMSSSRALCCLPSVKTYGIVFPWMYNKTIIRFGFCDILRFCIICLSSAHSLSTFCHLFYACIVHICIFFFSTFFDIHYFLQPRSQGLFPDLGAGVFSLVQLLLM